MFLGVDGGGTKTAICLLTGQGDVVGRAEVAGTYSPDGDLSRMEALLGKGIAAVCAQAGTTPEAVEFAFLALPGYGEALRLVPAFDDVCRRVLGHRRFRCDNDMVAGWAGSLGCADGVNVISGTGSIAFGRYDGRGARAGGWGEVFGDEGSAYWIGVRALAAFSRMSDGREPRTALHAAIRRELATRAVVEQDLDVIDVVLNQWHGSRPQVAGLSRVVARAAQDGDAVAVAVLRQAADELYLLVEAVRHQLGIADGTSVRVSYSGGAFGASVLREAFCVRLASVDGRYLAQTPLYEPVVGAALFAAELAGSPLDGQARSRLPRQGSGVSE